MNGALTGVGSGPSLAKSATANLRHAQSLFHQPTAPLSDCCPPLPTNQTAARWIPEHEARLNTPRGPLESHAVRRFIRPTAYRPQLTTGLARAGGSGNQLNDRSIALVALTTNRSRDLFSNGLKHHYSARMRYPNE